MPRRGGCDLRVCEKVYWGRSLHSSSTTCKEEKKNGREEGGLDKEKSQDSLKAKQKRGCSRQQSERERTPRGERGRVRIEREGAEFSPSFSPAVDRRLMMMRMRNDTLS